MTELPNASDIAMIAELHANEVFEIGQDCIRNAIRHAAKNGKMTCHIIGWMDGGGMYPDEIQKRLQDWVNSQEGYSAYWICNGDHPRDTLLHITVPTHPKTKCITLN